MAADYEALTGSAAVVDLSDRTQIEIRGRDRVAFLHNLCTNDIRRLVPGTGCEAFLCNVQGRIVALVSVFVAPESLVLETVPDQAERIINHLDRYLIREDVELVDRRGDWSELLVAGPQAAAVLRPLASGDLPLELFTHAELELAGQRVFVRRVDWVGPMGWLIGCSRAIAGEAKRVVVDAGAMPCGLEAFETVRIEHGTPWYGQDITDKNLPQEVARDRRTISFTKGCYLGQETVARLDALGHVNRTLCGVVFDSDAPPASGDELFAAGKAVGHVTSAAFSPRSQAPLALAYVRVGHNTPDSVLEWQGRPGRIVGLPLDEGRPTPK